MAKFDRAKLKSANDKEFEKISGWLSQAPKVGLQAAVVRAHSEVMQSSHLYGQMVHDSSNAAFNWRIVVGGSATQTYYKGVTPVGNSWDKRTENSDTAAIIAAITERLHQDASLLDQTIWGGMKTTNVRLVNPIGGLYAENARLNEAASSWHSAATKAAEDALKRWEAAGPSTDWSRFSKDYV